VHGQQNIKKKKYICITCVFVYLYIYIYCVYVCVCACNVCKCGYALRMCIYRGIRTQHSELDA